MKEVDPPFAVSSIDKPPSIYTEPPEEPILPCPAVTLTDPPFPDVPEPPSNSASPPSAPRPPASRRIPPVADKLSPARKSTSDPSNAEELFPAFIVMVPAAPFALSPLVIVTEPLAPLENAEPLANLIVPDDSMSPGTLLDDTSIDDEPTIDTDPPPLDVDIPDDKDKEPAEAPEPVEMSTDPPVPMSFVVLPAAIIISPACPDSTDPVIIDMDPLPDVFELVD
jgi:hypothetical protein